MPVIRVPTEALASAVDTAALAMAVCLTPHQIAQLWQGAVIDVGEGSARRLAEALGVEKAALVVSTAAAANDHDHTGGRASNDDRDPIYDDEAPVMASNTRTATPHEREPVDMAALFERTIEQLVAESDGGYTDEDLELVANVLSAGELPSSMTPREVPSFLRSWLDPAAELRRAGRAEPEALLERVVAEAPKGAAKMARGIMARFKGATRSTTKNAAKKAPKE